MRHAALALVLALVAGAACSNSKQSGDDDPGACAGLTLSACRATAGCVPDQCAGCICDVTYRGCLPEGVLPSPCPLLGCPSGICCTDDMPCEAQTGSCLQPGADIGCGACTNEPGDCTGDGDCGAAMICEPIRCHCTGATACVPGCTDDTTCGEGTTCDVASARCVPVACPCPTNFTCTGGACARTTCDDDLDCDGYCVAGSCYAGQGTCQLPVP